MSLCKHYSIGSVNMTASDTRDLSSTNQIASRVSEVAAARLINQRIISQRWSIISLKRRPVLMSLFRITRDRDRDRERDRDRDRDRDRERETERDRKREIERE